MMFDQRTQIDLMVTSMKAERARYEPFYRDVDRKIVPGLYRGQLTDKDRGLILDDEILDSSPMQAHNILEAGFVAHVTPPGRMWHKFKISSDPDLAEFGPVARWLDDVLAIQFATYEQAGVYEMLQPFYGYMGSFGGGCLWTEIHEENGIHLRNLPVGSWWIALDEWGMPNAFYREMRLTIDNGVSRFATLGKGGGIDWSNFSAKVKSCYEKPGSRLDPMDVGHIVYRNPEYNPNYMRPEDKKFKSCYFEVGSNEKNIFLRESGYDKFPALYGPWDQIGEDVYGFRCPGRTVLSDVKQLYDDVETSGIAIAQLARPTQIGTHAAVAAARETGYLPGRFIPVSATEMKEGGLRPLHDKDPRVAEIEARIDGLRRRIERGYHTDTFRMLDFLEDRERTATEIAARQEERLVMLVGVLNRLSRRVLFPLAERTFANNFRLDRLPPIPEELEGHKLEIEIVSNMAQAMRAMNLTSIDRTVGTAAGIAEYYPEIVDKIDLDQVIDEVAKGTGAPARIIVDDKRVAQKRAARAEAQARAQAAMEAEQAANTVKTLGETPVEKAPGKGENALGAVLKGLRGRRA